MITVPIGSMPAADSMGSMCAMPAFIALAATRTSGTKMMLSLNLMPTTAMPAIRPSSKIAFAVNPSSRAFWVRLSTSWCLPTMRL